MEKIPDMINSEGENLKELQSKRRGEILDHIKTERSKSQEVCARLMTRLPPDWSMERIPISSVVIL